MKRALVALVLLFWVTGCLQAENSSSLDEGLYGSGDGTAEFLAARTIFSQNCGGSCHQYHTRTEAQLKTEGMFVAGNPEGSKLYTALAGATGSGRKDMPQGAPPLSTSDLDAIKTWIQNATP